MTDDYMASRTAVIVEEAEPTDSMDALTLKRFTVFVERLETLRCLSRDAMLRIVSNPEMVDAPASAIASRSVALAECLLAELGKAEAGEFITEEENMMQGALFGLFRQWYYDKQAREGGQQP